MSAAHTPGPWEIVEVSGDPALSNWLIKIGRHEIYFFPYVYQYGDESKTCGGYVRDHEMHANARLISAAPELLEALQGLDDAYCRAGSPLTREERAEDRKRLIAARAAIAKATGGQQ